MTGGVRLLVHQIIGLPREWSNNGWKPVPAGLSSIQKLRRIGPGKMPQRLPSNAAAWLDAGQWKKNGSIGYFARLPRFDGQSATHNHRVSSPSKEGS